jgi:predicted O-methyltransferase YrrM
VSATPQHPAVRSVLQRLRAEGERHDAEAKRLLGSADGTQVSAMERAEIFRQAPIAISEEVGRLLYLLARSRGPRLIVEFGCSLGLSAIHLGAALRDSGDGRLITTEIHPEKARAAAANLAQAGLEDLVEVRAGDALQTLRSIDQPVELLFLDGWNELYLPVLELLGPQLAPDALLVADLSTDDPALDPYLAEVRDARAWTSVTIPLDAGVEVSIRSI